MMGTMSSNFCTRWPVMYRAMLLLSVCLFIIMIALSEKTYFLERGTILLPMVKESAERNAVARSKVRQSERIQQPVSKDSRNNSNTTCRASNRIVFMKTHKTAGTTVASIFAGFALTNHLNVAYPAVGATFHAKKQFSRNLVGRTKTKNGTQWHRDKDGFDILYNHARYNRQELEAVVPKAKFITVLREPIHQFISSFHYFGFDRVFGRKIDSNEDPIDFFFRDPEKSMVAQVRYPSHSLHNHQLFDLGLEPEFYNDPIRINAHIRKLDAEFDLVLINEYLDESLVIMKHTLCWNQSDVFYQSQNVGNHQKPLHPDTIQKIKEWNAADYTLYDHFNKTFWRRVSQYGKAFDHDLKSFQEDNEKHIFKSRSLHHTLKPFILDQMSERGIVYEDV